MGRADWVRRDGKTKIKVLFGRVRKGHFEFDLRRGRVLSCPTDLLVQLGGGLGSRWVGSEYVGGR